MQMALRFAPPALLIWPDLRGSFISLMILYCAKRPYSILRSAYSILREATIL